ncbi:hypothetical protein R0J90_11720, partial [Micrococcus sp. SIMBA_144]
EYPDVDIFSTRYDGKFGTVAYPDNASQRTKDSLDGKISGWYSHLKNNEVFIRVKKNSSSSDEYNMGIVYGINSSSGKDIHEPNTIFSTEWGMYESTDIESGKWIPTLWNNRYDLYDNFSIKAEAKGKLTSSVKYSDKDFNYWNQANKDNYKAYNVYAELKDGSYQYMDGAAVVGIPNQTFTKTVE